MANESSPLLDGANGRALSNGSYRAPHDSEHSSVIRVSINTETTDHASVGCDPEALLATPTCGLSTSEASRRLSSFGPNGPSRRSLSLGSQLLRHVLRPRAVLVWGAVVLEVVQANVFNVVALLLYLIIISGIGWILYGKTRDARTALEAAVKFEAVVVRDGVHQTINASMLVPGDRLTLSPGVIVPADCVLCDGVHLEVDQSALTGKSFTVSVSTKDNVKMGTTVVSGEGEAIVVATGQQTFVANVSNLLVPSGRLFSETFAIRFSVAVLLAALGAVTPLVVAEIVRRENAARVLSFALVFSEMAIPLAMPAISNLLVAVGSQRLLNDRIVVTRPSSLEKLASIDLLCCDKTGTLTRDKLELQDDLPIFDPRGTREDVLVSAALAARWKEPPRNAVDTLVLNAIDLRPLDQFTLLDHIPFDPTSKRTESVVQGPTGRVFKVTKGAPESLLSLAHNASDVREAVEAKVMDLARRGISSLAVARTEDVADGKWIFLGVIAYLDPPRHDSKRVIEMAHDHGIQVKLATGDQAAIAVEACRLLGMGMTVIGADVIARSGNLSSFQNSHAEDIALVSSLGGIIEAADGYAHLLPHHKEWIVQNLQRRGWCCGVTGATVADVHAMEVADLSIALDGADDAARRAADILLGKPGLSIVINGVLAARGVFKRLTFFMAFHTLISTYWISWLVLSGLLVRPEGCNFRHFIPRDGHCTPSEDSTNSELVDPVFQLPLETLLLLGLLRELMSIALLHDKVLIPKQPFSWNIADELCKSVVSGAIAAFSTTLFLFLALDSWNSDGLLSAYGVGQLSIDQVACAVFMQISLMSTFSVLVVRSGDLAPKPTPSLIVVVITVLCASSTTSVAVLSSMPGFRSISAKLALFIWVYTAIWVVVQSTTLMLVATLVVNANGGLFGRSGRFSQLEAQRQNRIRLGSTFKSDDSTVRDSYVMGRAVKPFHHIEI